MGNKLQAFFSPHGSDIKIGYVENYKNSNFLSYCKIVVSEENTVRQGLTMIIPQPLQTLIEPSTGDTTTKTRILSLQIKSDPTDKLAKLAGNTARKELLKLLNNRPDGYLLTAIQNAKNSYSSEPSVCKSCYPKIKENCIDKIQANVTYR